MPLPDLKYLLAEVRSLNQTIREGGPKALHAFRDLTQLVLNATVMASGNSLKLIRLSRDRTKAVLGGTTAGDPLVLNDRRYLRVSVKLYVDQAPESNFLKVEETSFQYQLDRDGRRWIFRYDYLRYPQHAIPAAHLQIKGQLAESQELGGPELGRLHFPTGRVSIEAVIRLLAEQFNVRCHHPPEIWHAVLAESERDFLRVAHQPLSGPER